MCCLPPQVAGMEHEFHLTDKQSRWWPGFHSHIACYACKACLFHLLHDCRNISESMKGLWKNSATRRSQVSASLMDKPKVCSYCGTVGHNRRGCPKLHPQKQHTEKVRVSVRVSECVRACVRACVCACVCLSCFSSCSLCIGSCLKISSERFHATIWNLYTC